MIINGDILYNIRLLVCLLDRLYGTISLSNLYTPFFFLNNSIAKNTMRLIS